MPPFAVPQNSLLTCAARTQQRIWETTNSLLPQFVVVFLGRGSALAVILSEGEGSRLRRVETLRFRSRRARRVAAAARQAGRPSEFCGTAAIHSPSSNDLTGIFVFRPRADGDSGTAGDAGVVMP
jgi:hypothetical protein